MKRICRACGTILDLNKHEFSKEGKGASRSVYYCKTHSNMSKKEKAEMFTRRTKREGC